MKGQIEPIYMSVCPIKTYLDKEMICQATGFFYGSPDNLFFLTNKHVLIDKKKGYEPDKLEILVHRNPNDIRETKLIEIPLYSKKKPIWKEHPKGNFDVVAIDLNRFDFSKIIKACVNSDIFLPNNLILEPGGDLMVLGYPLGFSDFVFNLPIIRNASISSAYGVPFCGNPYFLIDARLHSGMSGSPVFTKPNNMYRDKQGNTSLMVGSPFYFLGIFSANISAQNIKGEEIESLDLNIVWYSELIEEIIK